MKYPLQVLAIKSQPIILLLLIVIFTCSLIKTVIPADYFAVNLYQIEALYSAIFYSDSAMIADSLDPVAINIKREFTTQILHQMHTRAPVTIQNVIETLIDESCTICDWILNPNIAKIFTQLNYTSITDSLAISVQMNMWLVYYDSYNVLSTIYLFNNADL
ncbi:Hypothetical_protein [Hexamita inflata]|uniref:Hypothetical_protein n=1 Tax=Hexamita inflata TaxID=28002 RepID=A0AA86PIY1_9EUKA|nr:Hypothetical protein HINF_LOCUS17803 [Hexamita inflata]CAI9940605.1 Hypothetical protein HINF_LOCUS28250 [Hexamita inflata]